MIKLLFLMIFAFYPMATRFSLERTVITNKRPEDKSMFVRINPYNWMNSNDQVERLMRIWGTEARQKLMETKRKHQKLGFAEKIISTVEDQNLRNQQKMNHIWNIPFRRIF